MKSYLSVILLLSSVSAMAQVRPHECPRPGLMNSRMTGQSSDLVSASHNRVGSMDIPESMSVTGVLRTKIFDNFVDRVCVAKPYVSAETVCQPIAIEVALGQGNELFKSLFNMSETSLNRAQRVVQNLRYSENRPSGERLDTALQIVTQLTRQAAAQGLPRSWDQLVSSLNQAMKEGYLTFQVLDDITNIYQAANKRALGFMALEGARINQGVGNGRLNTVFDLGLSRDARAARIQSLLLGVNYSDAMALSSSFISFAANNGIPSTWDQFALMIRTAVTSGGVNPRVEAAILVDFEQPNRQALGFELSAELCQATEMKRVQNVVEIVNRVEVAKVVTQPYEINLASGPLLQDETENMVLTTNGMRALDLKINSSFNRYQVKGAEVNGIMKFIVSGQRLAVRPPNKLKVKFNKMGANLNVRIINQGFNPKAGGKVMVKVRYINGKVFNDDTKATEIYELNGANELVQTAAAKNDKVDFVKVSVQIVGSPFYNSEYSEEVKAKD